MSLSPLPLAEHIAPDEFAAEAEVLAAKKRQNRAVVRFDRAWNGLEKGISASSEPDVDQAFEKFTGLANDSSYHLELTPFGGVSTVLAYERAFRRRLAGEPLGEQDMDHTYRGVASLITQTLELGYLSDSRQGSLAELIVLGGLIRQKDPSAFPYPGSPREEKSEDARFNHDSYPLQLSGAGINKVPVQVKAKIPAEKKTDKAVVRVVEVLPVLDEVIGYYPGLYKRFTTGKSTFRARENAKFAYVADLMVAEATGVALPSLGLEVLQDVTDVLVRETAETAQLQAQNQNLPSGLSHNLGTQMASLLNRIA